jgi:guanyl-specific ribonuclease Sa
LGLAYGEGMSLEQRQGGELYYTDDHYASFRVVVREGQ